MGQSLKQKLVARASAVKMGRTTFEQLYRELDQWVLPDRTQFNITDANQGQIRTTSIIDETPILATRTLGAGLHSGMTSPARPWFQFNTDDGDLQKYAPVKAWLHDCAEILRREFRKSNLYQVLPEAYENVGVFGTNATLFDEEHGREDLFRFYNQPIGSYWLASNARNEIDCHFREMTMTVSQVVERFGRENCSPSVRQSFDNNNLENPVGVMHAVCPNPDYDQSRLVSKFKRYLSAYWESTSSASEDNFLSRMGYDDFPVLCPRWTTTGRNVYGFGCGRIVIGSSKALQAYERRTAEAVAKEVNPPLQAPSSLKGQEVQTIPGGITYYDEETQAKGIRSLYEMRFPYEGAERKAERCRQMIQRGLFEDLFLMLANSDRRQVTAEEIRAKQEEKILAIGPVLERLNDELLDPLVERGFSICQRRGIFPPPPPEMAGRPIGIEYVSILGQVQKMLGIGAIDRVLGVVGNMAAADPTVLDNINRDRIVGMYVDMTSADPSMLNSDTERSAIRKARANAMQAQQQQTDLSGQAQTAQVLSKIDTRGNNGLTDLIRTSTGSQI